GKVTYDNFIVEFLKGERLPLNTLSRPRSWNHLLWHLMRSSLYQTGLDLGENSSKSNYDWLHGSPSETKEPWVNWMELFDIYSEQVDYFERSDYENDQNQIFWVLEYFEDRAFQNVAWNLKMTEAWISNPYLL
ncbi:hypothetical protein CSPX01_10172, partial [Colletotrichum filicis]